MNYYIQGDAAKAEQIKAAFERLGYDVKNWLFTTGVYYTLNGRIVNTKIGSNEYELILNSSDYKELELAVEPHYDIANFKPYDKVLVRDYDEDEWWNTFFGSYDEQHKVFVCDCYNFKQCIPFEGNETLLGTNDMCNERFINW